MAGFWGPKDWALRRGEVGEGRCYLAVIPVETLVEICKTQKLWVSQH